MSETEITLELTGPLARVVGQSEVSLPCEPDDRLGAVLVRLVSTFPAAEGILGSRTSLETAAGKLPPGLLVVRNAATVPSQLETPVAAGERITLLPMISGG